MSKIIKVATIFEENTRYGGRPENPVVKETTTSADKTPCATYTALPLTPGRIYKFTTTISSLMNWGAALVNSEGIVTRQFLPAVTNHPHAYTVIPVAGEVRMYINNRDYGEIEVTYDAEEANFMPGTYEKTSFRPFRFWCQTVLPLVYDDSLSYYELLSKVVDYLNNAINDLNTLTGEYAKIRDAYKELESFVNNYFDNLDVSSEINAKLDQMAEDGDFDELMRATLESLDYVGLIGNAVSEQIDGVVGEQIGAVVGEQIGATVGEQIDEVVGEQIDGVVGEQIGGVVGEQIGGAVSSQIDATVASQIDDVVEEHITTPVENWLGRNFTEPPLDKTLSINNAAADAKVTGDAIAYARDVEVEFYKHAEIRPNGQKELQYAPGYWSIDGEGILHVIQGGDYSIRDVVIVTGVIGGAKYHVTMTYELGNQPCAIEGYSDSFYPNPGGSRSGKFIGNLTNYGAPEMGGSNTSYDFEFVAPYNCDSLAFNIRHGTSFECSVVSNHFIKDYDIDIEGYKHTEIEKQATSSATNKYVDFGGAIIDDPNYQYYVYDCEDNEKVRVIIPVAEGANAPSVIVVAHDGTEKTGEAILVYPTEAIDGVIDKEIIIPQARKGGYDTIYVNCNSFGTGVDEAVYEIEPWSYEKENANAPFPGGEDLVTNTSYVGIMRKTTQGGATSYDYDWRKAIPEPPTNADDDYILKARVVNGNITYIWELA